MGTGRWFIGQNGQKLGPYGLETLRQLAERVKLLPEDLLWTDGMPDWRRADSLEDLALFPSSPRVSPSPTAISALPTSPAGSSEPPFSAAAPPASTSSPEPISNYFVRHWRGELSLPVAYWVNQFLLTLVITALAGVISTRALGAHFGPEGLGAYSLILVAGSIALTFWQLMGVWRSAQAHPARGGSRTWATVAQITAVLGLLRLFNLAIEQAPAIRQSAELILKGDTMPSVQLRVLNHGTEVEVAGALAFGTAQKLEVLLQATPSIRMVQLNNIGGWISEGEALKALIESRGLSTYTATECASACLIAFMGGKARYLGSKGRLGFHEASVGGVGGEVASFGTNEFREVFSQKNVPSAFIDRALSTPPSSMWYPTAQELLKANVVTAVVNERDYAMTGISGWQDPAALETQLLSVPVYAALRKLDPRVYGQVKDMFITGIQEGVSQSEMAAKIRSTLIQKVLPQYLRQAPDEALISYWKTQLTEIGELRAIDPRYCTAFLFPAPSGGPDLEAVLSKQTRAADVQGLADVLEATARMPATVPQLGAVQRPLIQAMTRAERRVPGTINRVSDPKKAMNQPKELCDSVLAFYEEVLRPPSQQSGPLLRYLLANSE